MAGVKMRVRVLYEDGVEVVDCDGKLADGSLASVREKFASSIQSGMIRRLIDEALDGSLYLGNWQNGEIQIVGIVRIATNRYWTEIEYAVLFPPRPGKTEPAAGTYRYIVWNAGVEAGAAALLFTIDGDVIILNSFRHAVRRWCLEIPRGVRKPGESDADCAMREAREECGAELTAESQVIALGSLEPDTGVLRNRVPVVLITNVIADETKVRRDVSESALYPVRLTKAEFLAKVKAGEIKDALLLAAYTQAIAHGVI